MLVDYVFSLFLRSFLLQVHLTDKEKQKLQVWSRIMPYKESFAWAMIPLFEGNHAGGLGDAASPSSPLAPSISGSSSQDSIVDPISKLTLDGKLNYYSSGSSVIVEISNLNKVKESYIEDSLHVRSRSAHSVSICYFYHVEYLILLSPVGSKTEST